MKCPRKRVNSKLPDAERVFNPSRQTHQLLARAEHIGPNTLALCRELFEQRGREAQNPMWSIVGLSPRYPACILEQAAAVPAGLDDLFLARRIALESADELQSILHRRYKLRRSNLITSNRIIADWDKYLGDAALTTCILDRLTHRSVLVEFRGKSYRPKEAASRLVKGNDSE